MFLPASNVLLFGKTLSLALALHSKASFFSRNYLFSNSERERESQKQLYKTEKPQKRENTRTHAFRLFPDSWFWQFRVFAKKTVFALSWSSRFRVFRVVFHKNHKNVETTKTPKPKLQKPENVKTQKPLQELGN